MKCRELMKQNVQWIAQTDTIQAAARLMKIANVGFLPVVDGVQRACGTLTDRDLAIRAVSEASAPDSPVSSVMTREVVSCSPDDDLTVAESLMASRKKSRIMCIDADGSIVGVISLSDIAQVESARKAAKTLEAVTEREART